MSKSNKGKLFIENFFVYGFGGIISKLVPIIMVPIVTRLMPDTSYYGISDLATTLVSISSYIAIMGMYDAMYRLFFENDDGNYKKSVCSTTVVFTIGMSLVVALVLVILRNGIARLFFGDEKYTYLVVMCAVTTFVSATNGIVSAPTRMENKRKIFLVTNTIGPILSYSISVPLLLKGHYIMALPLATLISGIIIEITFVCLNHKWFSLKNVNTHLLKQLLVIAVPLIPNVLAYWLFNSSDRLMITNMLGTAAAGIYTAGSKLGYMSNLIYTAFAGGWQFFAFSTMKEKDQVQSNSLVYEYLGIISFVVTAFISAFSYFIFELLFAGDYVNGYIVAPYLFLAPLLQMLFQVQGNQFLVIKKTWPTMLILFGGVVANILLNLVLIPILGIEGAAIATLAGYTISNIICAIVLFKMKLMCFSKRFIFACVLLCAYFMGWRLLFQQKTFISVVIAMILVGVYVLLYIREVKWIINKYKLWKGKKHR